MRAPSLIFGSSITGTFGGRMLETLIRLMLPMPAASSALSKALRGVPPSAWPAVAAAIVTVFVIRSSSPRDLASQPFRRDGGEEIFGHFTETSSQRKRKVTRRRVLRAVGGGAARWRAGRATGVDGSRWRSLGWWQGDR